ncbi:MAG: hypothetical protein WBV82_20480 [Myxococcaceae bacterium]
MSFHARRLDRRRSDIYCSELVYKAYLRGAGVHAGRLQKVRELDLSAIEKQVIERYGTRSWSLLGGPIRQLA